MCIHIPLGNHHTAERTWFDPQFKTNLYACLSWMSSYIPSTQPLLNDLYLSSRLVTADKGLVFLQEFFRSQLNQAEVSAGLKFSSEYAVIPFDTFTLGR